jgi:tetratricopeptide (TPR) repeat protein
MERGRAYFAKGDYERAIVDFTKAIELRPQQSVGTIYQRALAFTGLGELDNAIADLEKVVALTKDLEASDMVALRKAAEQELRKLKKQ